MLAIINTILPVYILIAAGWLAIHFKLFNQAAKKACAKLVSDFIFPALLLLQTLTTDINKILDVRWLVAFFCAMVLIWLFVMLVGKFIFKQPINNIAMEAMLCAFPNMGGMGIPFLIHIIGVSALVSVAKANFVVSLTLIPVTVMLLQLHMDHGKGIFHVIISAIISSIKTPMFLAVVIGTLINVIGLSKIIPAFALNTLHTVAESCVFISLFTVGLALHGAKIHLSKRFIFNLIMKGFVCAFIAWIITLIFHIEGNSAKELIYLLAMPTATIATILAMKWNAEPVEATSTYLATTLLSIFTLPVLVYLLG